MGEKFETRLMELMLERSKDIPDFCRHDAMRWDGDTTYIEPSEAIECVRQMLSEFNAVIYQP